MAVGDRAIVLQRDLHQRTKRCQRRTRGDRIARVGGDQQRRAVAAPERALEIRRDFHPEQNHSRLQQAVELGFIVHHMRDLEIAGVLERADDGASDIARFLHQHRRRKIAWLRVDGVAEQQKLHQRNRDHGRERDAIAPKLQEFLDQHRADPPEEAAGRRERAHDGLAEGPLIRSIKTSSSEETERRQSSAGSAR